MRERLHALLAALVRHLARRAIHAWREAPAAPRPVGAGLDIPLLPSPLARRLRLLFVVVQGIYALELLLLGHGVVAAGLAAAAVLPWWLRRGGEDLKEVPRRLLVAADGRLHLLTVAGSVVPAHVHPSSLRLGPWLVLRLDVPGARSRRLVLGPDNLDAAALAALRRRMVLVDQAAETLLPGLGALASPRHAPGTASTPRA